MGCLGGFATGQEEKERPLRGGWGTRIAKYILYLAPPLRSGVGFADENCS